ncbi:MAG: DUF1376 domain-containing protein [Rhodobacteraceae bacterium]|nr:DUF1376 domain-containing protein [Paracoccaceae bacterium]
MSNFYKLDPAKWDNGTANLSLEEEAAYLRIVNAIHKHDGGVPDNDRVIAGMFRCSTRKARALVNALVAAGKLTIEGGEIWNDRARSDLVHRGFVSNSMAENGAKGGRTRAENASKALKEKEPDQATASSRIEENRIEYSEANASAENGQDEDDFAKQVFDRAVVFLGRHGVGEKQARAFVGKLRKSNQDVAIFEAFTACGKAGAVDPIPWISAALTPRPQTRLWNLDPDKFDDNGNFRQ